MSTGPNHKRGHGRIQGNGPRWENKNPEAGCNSTHVARSRSKWKKRHARRLRRTGATEYPWGHRTELPTADEEEEMHEDTEMAMAIGKLALAFGRVNRATYHEDGELPESDTTHTVMLGLIACTFAPNHYDRGRIAELCLVHDLVEAKCGDTNSFAITPKAQAEKRAREEEALRQLHVEFVDATWLMTRLIEYEEQESLEARYVRFVDKAMPKITHALNGCSAIKTMGRSVWDLRVVHDTQLRELLEQYPELEGTNVHRLMRELMRASEEAY